ncbi:unnamed protein product [Angiostrongylus costaricensis]|uniref:Lipoprotein n=1 Tax=Angiostrongylus costaricensis TaxID=334426 RepID=A0A0R3Q0E6_ANGCS|nr:unnamed protein product [Angiostrongylus costaricensis]
MRIASCLSIDGGSDYEREKTSAEHGQAAWFDKVINDTIRKDLDKANNAVSSLTMTTYPTIKKLAKELKVFEEQAISGMKTLKNKEVSVNLTQVGSIFF